MKQEFLWKNGGNTMKRDLVDELYKTAYKRYREKYPNKDFASIPNFLDSLWFSIEGELNRNGYIVKICNLCSDLLCKIAFLGIVWGFLPLKNT